MSKLEDNVNDILGIEKKEEKFSLTEFEQPAPVPRKIDETKDDVDNDYSHSRDNYYNLIDKGNEAIEGILDIAKEGQHPRAYEVAGQLIGQVAQTVDKLQDLQGNTNQYKMKQGEYWYMDKRKPHAVYNHGSSFRYHMIFDTKINQDILDRIIWN